MADASSTPDVGPSEAPPAMPFGWIAQWDNNERKYYYVEISTGKSTWEIPTKPAPGVGTTPISSTEPSQFKRPEGGPNAAGDGAPGDRGLTSMAMHALAGKPSSGQSSSPFGGLAQQFLSGSSSHSGGSSTSHGNTSGSGGMAGQLIESLLAGSSNKPPSQTSSAGYGSTSATYGGSSQSSSHQSGGQSGLSGLLSGVLGGGHGSNQHQNNYGYSQGSGSHDGYSGTAPAASYKPPSHSGTPQTSSYQSTGYQQAHSQQTGTIAGTPQPQGHSPQPNYSPGQYQQSQQSTGGQSQYPPAGSYPGSQYPHNQQGPGNQIQSQADPDQNRPFYVGGDPYQYQQPSYQPNYPPSYGNQYSNQNQQHFSPPPYSGQPGQPPYNPQQPPYRGNYNSQHPNRR